MDDMDYMDYMDYMDKGIAIYTQLNWRIGSCPIIQNLTQKFSFDYVS